MGEAPHRKNGASGWISVRNLRAFSFMNVTLRVAMLYLWPWYSVYLPLPCIEPARYPPGRSSVQSAAPAQQSSRLSP